MTVVATFPYVMFGVYNIVMHMCLTKPHLNVFDDGSLCGTGGVLCDSPVLLNQPRPLPTGMECQGWSTRH